jgi:hypothetical protein
VATEAEARRITAIGVLDSRPTIGQSERLHRLDSVHDERVRDRVSQALHSAQDLAVWRRINRGGGSTDWYVLRNVGDFDQMVAHGRPADVFLIFLRPQLQMRGVVADELIDALLLQQRHVKSDSFVIGFVEPGSCQLSDARDYMPEDIEWAREILGDHVGEPVVAGPFPPSLSEDQDEVLAAYVPQSDGSVVSGTY